MNQRIDYLGQGLLLRASRRFWQRHPLQLLLAVLGIALGVAIVIAVDLTRASAIRAFELSTEATVGKATHRINGGVNGLEETFYTQLRVKHGIRTSAPVVQGLASLPGWQGMTLQIIGIDPFAEQAFRDYRRQTENGQVNMNALLVEPDTGLLSRAMLARLGLRSGQTLTLQVRGKTRTLKLLGWFDSTEKITEPALENILVTDIATAQEWLDMIGSLSYIDLILTEPQRIAEIEKILPPQAEMLATGKRTETMTQMTEAFHINLKALSLVALLVGAFLIYNTVNALVLRRRFLLGILRALGVSQSQVFMLVLTEALLLGLMGTLIGFLLGIVLTQGLLHLVTRTINDIYFVLTVRQFTLSPWVVTEGLLLGVGMSLLAAFMPAREAAETPPRLVQTRSLLEAKTRSWVTVAAYAGVVVLLLGTALIFFSERSLTASFAGMFAWHIGSALLTPWFIVRMARHLEGWRGSSGLLWRLGVRTLTAALSRTSPAIAALMVALASTITVGLMVGSFRTAVIDWLETILQADLYVTTDSPVNTAVLSEGLYDRIKAMPGVRQASSARWFKLETEQGMVQVISYRFVPQSRNGFRFYQGDPATLWPQVEQEDAVLISEPFAYRCQLQTGSRLRLRTDQGVREFTVAGVYRDYSNNQGVVAMSHRTFARYWRDNGYVTSIGVYAEPGQDLHVLRQQLEALGTTAGLPLQVNSNRAIVGHSLEVFDRTFLVTQVLRLLAAIVAGIGIVSALSALQLERTRELGILRACGMLPQELQRLLIIETGLMGTIAGLIAIPFGTIIAYFAVLTINQRAFGWHVDLQVDAATLLNSLVLGLIAALLAGWYPAYKIAHTSPATAMRME